MKNTAAKKQPSSPVVALPTNKPFRAFAVLRVDGGWSFVDMTVSPDGLVTQAESTEPNMRAIAQERFKITAQKHWNGE